MALNKKNSYKNCRRGEKVQVTKVKKKRTISRIPRK